MTNKNDTSTTSKRMRYTRQAIVTSAFLQLPRFLYAGEFAGNRISNNARNLYTLLLDRHKISIKNDWHDESGEVYIYFKREEMEQQLGISERTVSKVMQELKDLSLVEEKKQGLEPGIFHESIMHFVAADRKGFFPSPGQIMGIVEDIQAERERQATEERIKTHAAYLRQMQQRVDSGENCSTCKFCEHRDTNALNKIISAWHLRNSLCFTANCWKFLNIKKNVKLLMKRKIASE